MGLAFTKGHGRAPSLLRLRRELREYREQGIPFYGHVAPIGSEAAVTSLLKRGLTRDDSIPNPAGQDFVGTTRGLRVQLYAVSRPAVDAITVPEVAGVVVDRDTPARRSIGRMTPCAVTFASASSPGFRLRKQSIRRAVTPELALRCAVTNPVPVLEGLSSNAVIDVRPVVTNWARSVMRDVIWGPESVSAHVAHLNVAGPAISTDYDLALHDTFRRVRQRTSSMWLRILPFASTLPISSEAIRISRNITRLREAAQEQFELASTFHAAHKIHDFNSSHEIPLQQTVDDITTCFLAGVDTLTAAALTGLWHVLHPDQLRWRDMITGAPEGDRATIARACLEEATRVNPPGSLFNNSVTTDSLLAVGERTYRLRSGTRIVPHIYAVHEEAGADFDPSRILDESDAFYSLTFGRGVRSCPGKPAGIEIAAVLINEFVRSNPDAMLSIRSAEACKLTTSSNLPLEVCSKDGTPATGNG